MNRTRYTDPAQPTAARRRRQKVQWVLVPALLLGVLAAGTGCEESVDAIVGSDIPFTVWGFMNAGTDTQYVRVFAVTDQLVPDPGASLDARVFSTNLTTGERREWAYEAVRFDSLISGHYFWSPFRSAARSISETFAVFPVSSTKASPTRPFCRPITGSTSWSGGRSTSLLDQK